jgi:hypothetical protein
MAARKGNSKERRARIASYIDVAGAYRISLSVKQELAKEFDVSVRQIGMDVEKILMQAIKPKIERIQGQFLLTLNSNLDNAHELKRSTDPLIKARGIDAANKTIMIYTDFLEKFGFKEKTTQKSLIEGSAPIIFKLITKSYEDIKKEKECPGLAKIRDERNDGSFKEEELIE